MPRVRAAPAASFQPSLISSRENRWVQRFRPLLPARVNRGGWSGIEGVRLVEEALRSELPVEAILVSETAASASSGFCPHCEPIRASGDDRSNFRGVAGAEAPQGIAALVRPKVASFDDLLECGPPLVVVLVGMQDPGNTGTILRTAEAMGADGVAACRAGSIGAAHPFSPKVLRASAGSAFRFRSWMGCRFNVANFSFAFRISIPSPRLLRGITRNDQCGCSPLGRPTCALP